MKNIKNIVITLPLLCLLKLHPNPNQIISFCQTRLVLGIEASNNMEDISLEDQKFLKLTDEKSTKVGEHFEIPLPLKDISKTSKQ